MLCGCLLMVVALSSGCATKALWEADPFARYREPAVPNGLRLARRGNEVLVRYQETVEGKDLHRPRSFWLQPNLARLEAKQKPVFAIGVPEDALTGMPLFDTQLPPPEKLPPSYGRWEEAQKTFSVVLDGKTLGSWTLPVYDDGSGRAKLMAWTPPALMLDLTIVGGVIAYWALPGILQAVNGRGP